MGRRGGAHAIAVDGDRAGDFAGVDGGSDSARAVEGLAAVGDVDGAEPADSRGSASDSEATVEAVRESDAAADAILEAHGQAIRRAMAVLAERKGSEFTVAELAFLVQLGMRPLPAVEAPAVRAALEGFVSRGQESR